jgi:hypothetical protein
LEGVLIIGDSVAESLTGLCVANRGDFGEAQQFVNDSQRLHRSDPSPCQVKEGCKAVTGQKDVESEIITPLEHPEAGGEKRRAPLSDVEQDIGIKKYTHRR